MRRFLFGITAITILVILTGAGATATLAAAGPLQPGNPLFPWQYFAEQSQAQLIPTNIGRAQHFISITERRAVDMKDVAGSENEILAIYYLNQALDQTALAIAQTETKDLENLRISLAQLVSQIREATALPSIVPTEHPLVFEVFSAKIDSLQILVVNPDTLSSSFATLVGNDGSLDTALTNTVTVPNFVEKDHADNQISGEAQAVPFPSNSPGAQHDFFPLVGAHALIACESCHTAEQYVGTSTTCEGCHSNLKPATHFAGTCSACHSPSSWHDVTFDHVLAGAKDCQSCHSGDQPVNHYSGQCSQCHSTSTWAGAKFHVAGANCQACHNRPAGHYAGQCSQCHSMSTWAGAVFHTAGANCQTCHNPPSGHYGGQCSQCHSTSGWGGAVGHFAGANCTACHSGHTTQQCSNCHNTSSWDDAEGEEDGEDGENEQDEQNEKDEEDEKDEDDD